METKEYNSFKFFRTYFNIPKWIKLEWCVVKEHTEQEGVKLRLGIALNERLYIDVASRRFFTCLDAPCLQRTIYPADRINEGENYRYQSRENILSLVLPKRYIEDIYRPAWFDASFMEEERLY